MQTGTPQPHEETIMARTTFSGPVKSDNGFEGSITGNVTGNVTLATFVALTPVLTSALPTAAAGNAGQVRLISDNGAGNNEFCLVISTGSAWVTAVGAALS
jgi:hypothetical protein